MKYTVEILYIDNSGEEIGVMESKDLMLQEALEYIEFIEDNSIDLFKSGYTYIISKSVN